jgi:hypothetical protein
MCNAAGYRPFTHGDLAIEHPQFPKLVITKNNRTLQLVRDYLTRLDMIVNTELVFKCFSDAKLSPEEVGRLRSYGLPEVDARLVQPHFCSTTLLTSTGIPAPFIKTFLPPRPPSLVDNFIQTYWIFRRLVLGDCTHIPHHYTQNYTIYMIEAMHRNHIRVVKKAHAKGLMFHFDCDISKHPEVHFRVIHWLVLCGLLPFYTAEDPNTPLNGKIPPIIKLIFQHDRSEILHILLKGLGTTNQDTINYATQCKATKCIELLSQFPIL